MMLVAAYAMIDITTMAFAKPRQMVLVNSSVLNA
jgi:hypothetical protein